MLDIGCGPGQIGAFVRSCGHVVIGADRSTAMSAFATRALDGAVQADMRRLPFASESVGGLTAFYSLIHLPIGEVVVALRELRRVLRPGGRALVAVHEGEGAVDVDDFFGRPVTAAITYFAVDQLTSIATDAGFTVASTMRREPLPTERTVRLHLELVR